jgi:hypothetical protein
MQYLAVALVVLLVTSCGHVRSDFSVSPVARKQLFEEQLGPRDGLVCNAVDTYGTGPFPYDEPLHSAFVGYQSFKTPAQRPRCERAVNREHHIYLEFDVSEIYASGNPGQLLGAEILFDAVPDPENFACTEAEVIAETNFSASYPGARPLSFDLISEAGSYDIDSETVSFRDRQLAEGAGDSLARRGEGPAYRISANRSGVERIALDLSRGDTVSVADIAKIGNKALLFIRFHTHGHSLVDLYHL